MSRISLTASMRSNLLSIQRTANVMGQTQERLSTGKRVNSAIDNPGSYYTAQSLSNRANDLSNLLDNMGQAISTIKAADEGIEAITAYVEQAKAVATSAFDTSDNAARGKYMTQFNEIRSQIDKLASDSGYKGINLLTSSDSILKVTFNESRDNFLEIHGVNATTGGDLNIHKAAWGVGRNVPDDAEDAKSASHAAIAVGDVFKYNDDYYVATSQIAATVVPTDISAHEKLIAVKDEDNSTIYMDMRTAQTGINTAITETTEAITTLRNMSSDFGNNYSIVQTRENFTQNLIDVLEEGADKLTLADMNEESANMLALQTRQQLAINSLSLASQAAQSVLKLFS